MIRSVMARGLVRRRAKAGAEEARAEAERRQAKAGAEIDEELWAVEA